MSQISRTGRAARLALVTLAALATVGICTSAADAVDPTVSEVSVDPVSMVDGAPGYATLTVTSSACVTLQALTVSVRDSGNTHLDFPGAVTNVQVCPSGYTYTSGTQVLSAGTYSIFGAYKLNNQWYPLASKTLSVGPAGSATRPSWMGSGSYSATFDDEFNGSTLDATKWSTGWYPGQNNDPVTAPVQRAKPSSYEDDCYDPANVSVGGGSLNLLLSHVASSCTYNDHGTWTSYSGDYTGSMIQSRDHFTQQGGSFEARVYAPRSAVSSAKVGAWPSWWLNGHDNASVSGWPQHGEIDLMEGFSDGDTKAHTHYPDGSGGDAGGPAGARHGADPYVGWHDFGVSWTPSGTTADNVTFYWDGRSIESLTMTSLNPEYLIFANTLSGVSLADAVYPAAVKVDWVRAWSTPLNPA